MPAPENSQLNQRLIQSVKRSLSDSRTYIYDVTHLVTLNSQSNNYILLNGKTAVSIIFVNKFIYWINKKQTNTAEKDKAG